MNLTFDEIINFTHEVSPRIIYEMDGVTYSRIKTLKDTNGAYLWLPCPNHPNLPGTFLGYEIALDPETMLQFFQIKYLFPNGESFTLRLKITTSQG